jgi:multidrug transporter EmrE-like cation transporter
MTLGFFLYKTYVKKEKIQLKKAFNSSILPLFAILMVLKFISIYYTLGIFKKMNVSKYVPIFKSLSIVATIILSVLFLNERRNPKDIFGIALIVIGVYILNNVDLGVSTNA